MKCDELRPLMCAHEPNVRPMYDKSEVDKAIAELKQKLADKDKEIAELKDGVVYWKKVAKKNMDDNVVMAKQRAEALKRGRHNKYKRCLAMADKCSEALCYWDNVKYTFFKGEAYCFRKMNHYGKWGQIWLAIAEKFEEAK